MPTEIAQGQIWQIEFVQGAWEQTATFTLDGSERVLSCQNCDHIEKIASRSAQVSGASSADVMTVDYKDKSHGGSFTVRNFGGKASATCQVMVRPELRTTAAMIQQASGDKAEKATCTVLRVTRFLN